MDGCRTSRINALRGFCREFGLAIPQGARTGVEAIARVLADPDSSIPGLIRGAMKLLIEEVRLLEARVTQLEKELTELAKHSPACKNLLTIPSIGLLTATAMVAPPAARSVTTKMRVTSRAGSGSRPRNTPRGVRGTWGASLNAETAISGCCSRMAREPCYAQPLWPSERANQ